MHIDDDEKHGIMMVTKKNDAKFNFLIVQVSEVVDELQLISGKVKTRILKIQKILSLWC